MELEEIYEELLEELNLKIENKFLSLNVGCSCNKNDNDCLYKAVMYRDGAIINYDNDELEQAVDLLRAGLSICSCPKCGY